MKLSISAILLRLLSRATASPTPLLHHNRRLHRRRKRRLGRRIPLLCRLPTSQWHKPRQERQHDCLTVGDYDTIVTIQFDHNDQEALTLDQYKENLVDLATDIREFGATPIITTPLTRRNFNGDTVKEDFVNWRLYAIDAAESVGADYLDLTTASTDYINAIGDANAATYDLSEGDGTHINTAGQTVFGRFVADLLLQKRGDLEEYIIFNEVLSENIWNGEYATGDE
ncbi:SGNH hydrolase-type esterase domain-containing protein [Aspergillus crustosus]